MSNKKTCFVVCPIGIPGSHTRTRSDKLLKHILAPVCNECNFELIRVDQINSADTITETILNQLQDADLVIADLSEHNPNAFYEIGYRSSTKKPIIHLKEKSETLPFDVSSIRTFDYDITDLDLVEELKNRLIQTINSFTYTDNSVEHPLPQADTLNAQILSELFKIQDLVKSLHTTISNKDNSTISTILDKLAQTNSKSPEVAMIEAFAPLLSNPDAINCLAQLGAFNDSNNNK